MGLTQALSDFYIFPVSLLSVLRLLSTSSNVSVIVGVILSLGIFCTFDRYYDRSAKANRPWAQRENNRRLPVACIASPWYVA
jgi:hypothetical protein